MGARHTRPVDVDAQTVAQLMMSGLPKPCPLCGAGDHQVVSLRDRNGNALRTVMCNACGHVFTNPAPSQVELTAYYTERYRAEYKGVITPKRKHVLRAGLRALERLGRLREFLTPPAKVLDVGAGGGEFAYLLSCMGFDVVGIEPNAGYAGFASQSYGLDIRGTILECVDFPANTFDAITMHHVLEHVANPASALKTLAGWLKPGGLMVVEVPNVMSWFHAPRRRFHAAHLHTFNRQGLEGLFVASGFSVENLMETPGTAHLNIVARLRPGATSSASFPNATANVTAHFQRHTELSHILSGMALKRLWGNAARPWREWRKFAALGNPTSARDILDRLFTA